MMEQQSRRRREIPEPLQKLAVTSSEYFFTERQSIIMDFMVKHDCIEEKEMLRLLQFDLPLLKAQMGDLLTERFIHQRTKLIDEPSARKPKEIVYYFVNYKSIRSIVQYKLYKMRQILEERAKKGNRNRQHLFQCSNPNCPDKMDGKGTTGTRKMRTFSEYEARELFHPDKNAYFCKFCGEPVEEMVDTDPNNSMETLRQFQQYTEPLLQILKDASNVCVDEHEPEPEIMQNVQVHIQPRKKLVAKKSKKPEPKNSADSNIKSSELAELHCSRGNHDNKESDLESDTAVIEIEVEYEPEPGPSIGSHSSVTTYDPEVLNSETDYDNLSEAVSTVDLMERNDGDYIVEFMSDSDDDSD